MFNLDAIKGQAKKLDANLLIEGMTFQLHMVDGKTAQYVVLTVAHWLDLRNADIIIHN